LIAREAEVEIKEMSASCYACELS